SVSRSIAAELVIGGPLYQYAGGLGDMGQQALDDLAHGDAFGLGAEIEEYAVTEDGQREGFQIFHGNMHPAMKQGPRFRAEDQVLAAAGSRAPAHEFTDESGCSLGARAARLDQLDGIARQGF